MTGQSAARQALAAWFDDVRSVVLAGFGAGHINDTWLVTPPGADRLVLQRLNPAVFPEPGAVAAKVAALVEHLNGPPARLGAGLRVPRLEATRRGSAWHEDAAGVWRLWEYVAPARTLDPLQNPAQAEAAGRACGAFQAALADFAGPADRTGLADRTGPANDAGLPDPIPGFLQLDHYLGELDAAVVGAGPLAEPAEAALEVVRDRRDLAMAFAARNRVIHGDCKVDNLLFHPGRDEVLAIIDLDTVMYGHWAWDFGDLVRSAAADGTACNVARFAAVCRGFTAAAAVTADTETLLLAPRYVGLMLGVRFLTDHLAGDRYFKVTVQGDNLTRARRQLALVRDMERQEAAMRQALRQG